MICLPPERNCRFVSTSSRRSGPPGFDRKGKASARCYRTGTTVRQSSNSISQKNFRALSPRISGDGSFQFSTGPPQQLGGIRFQHVSANLAAQELSLPVSLDQAGADQLFDVVRNGGLGDRKFLPELGTGARSFPGDHLEHLHPPGIGERLGNQLELLRGQSRPSATGVFHSSMVIELSSFCQDLHAPAV